jgi:DeoR family transcriptional regulator, fructose operon transcriptional repressor
MTADVDVRCDTAFIAVGGLAAEGLTTSNLGDAGMMSQMVQRARRTAILADSSKFTVLSGAPAE